MLIERITAFVNAQEEKQFLLFSTTRNEMVLEDVEDFDANIVLIDAMKMITESDITNISELAANMVNNRNVILLVQAEIEDIAKELKHKNLITDYLFLTEKLEELFTQLKQY